MTNKRHQIKHTRNENSVAYYTLYVADIHTSVKLIKQIMQNKRILRHIQIIMCGPSGSY